MKQKGTPQKNGVLRVGQRFHAFRHGLELLRGQPQTLAQLAPPRAGIGDAGRVRGEDRRRAAARNLDAMACRIFVRSPASSACSARAARLALWPTAPSGFPSSKDGFRAMSLLKYVPTSSPARTLCEDRVDGVAATRL